jgi:hypothetical protein
MFFPNPFFTFGNRDLLHLSTFEKVEQNTPKSTFPKVEQNTRKSTFPKVEETVT